MTVLLSVRGLAHSFYGLRALDGLDFDVRTGTITALIGPNGAGKTTAFQCISGVIAPDAGRIAFAGRNIAGLTPDRITRAGLTRTFQIARAIGRLSVLDNLLLYASAQSGESLWPALSGRFHAAERAALARAWAIADRLNLARVANVPAASLSGGQKKLLEIGRALMADPQLVLLDEPIAGVNPTLAAEIAEHLRALCAEGVTFLIVEHHMDMIAQLCDPVVVMAEGRRLAEGAFATIAADPAVQDAYMGRRRWQ